MIVPPIALVTGGSRRIGAACARHLAEQGWELLLHWHHSRKAAEAMQEELRPTPVTLLQADLATSPGRNSLLRQVLDALGRRRLGLVLHNASRFPHARLEDVDDALIDALFALHVKTPLLLSRDLAPRMTPGSGMIVMMLDAGAALQWPGYLPYALSKQALGEVTVALARELAPQVRVNGIAPGFILPPEDAPASYRQVEAMRLTRQGGSTADVLKALDYLVKAEFVTGEILTVDGGRRWIRPLTGRRPDVT